MGLLLLVRNGDNSGSQTRFKGPTTENGLFPFLSREKSTTPVNVPLWLQAINEGAWFINEGLIHPALPGAQSLVRLEMPARDNTTNGHHCQAHCHGASALDTGGGGVGRWGRGTTKSILFQISDVPAQLIKRNAEIEADMGIRVWASAFVPGATQEAGLSSSSFTLEEA